MPILPHAQNYTIRRDEMIWLVTTPFVDFRISSLLVSALVFSIEIPLRWPFQDAQPQQRRRWDPVLVSDDHRAREPEDARGEVRRALRREVLTKKLRLENAPPSLVGLFINSGQNHEA